jgi:hypothetical protein
MLQQKWKQQEYNTIQYNKIFERLAKWTRLTACECSWLLNKNYTLSLKDILPTAEGVFK